MKYCTSLFAQMLHLIPRASFERAVIKHGAEANCKGFSSWDQFAAMLFAQLGQAHSLREISYGLRTCLGKLSHLGLKQAPAKSTLSYANQHRPWQLFETIFYLMLEQCRSVAPQHRFRFKNKLLSMDATVIDLCLSLFPWANFRRTKGAVKLHLLLDHDGYLPTFAHITPGDVHELTVAKHLTFAPGSIIAMDRGYIDYKLLHRLTMDGVYFVTRERQSATYAIIEERTVPQNRNILADQTIKFTGFYSAKKYPSLLRRIVIYVPEKDEQLVLWTNHFKFGATTIAAIYKERWQIEIFFKTLKQHLRVKSFVGTTANALKTQIWTALITLLMIKYLRFRSKVGWSMSNLIAMLRFNLFTYRDLWKWLQDPFTIEPTGPPPDQLELVF